MHAQERYNLNQNSTVCSLQMQIQGRLCLAAGYLILILGLQNPLAAEPAQKTTGLINRGATEHIEMQPSALEELANSLGNIVKSIDEIVTKPMEPALAKTVEPPTITKEHVKADNNNAQVSPVTDHLEKSLVKTETRFEKLSPSEINKIANKIHALTNPVTDKPAESIASKPIAETETLASEKIEPPVVNANSKPVSIRTYLKRNSNGQIIAEETEQWACIEDTYNGLIWEVKSNNGGLRDKNNSYSWYNPETQLAQGLPDGGRCQGNIACDTHAFIKAINAQNFCGYADWRLPTLEEIQQLVVLEQEKNSATINTKLFPNTESSWYWTASSNTSQPEYAWYVLFRNGVKLSDLKQRPKHIRLVRSSNSIPQANNHVESSDDSPS